MSRLLLLFFVPIFTFSCEETQREKDFMNRLQFEPVKEAYNVELIFTEMALLKAELTAPHVKEKMVDNVDVRIMDKGLHMTFYKEDGEIDSDLVADYGEFRNNFTVASLFGLENRVVMTNVDGDRLETDTLYWDKNNDRIHTPANVKIFTKTEIIYGDSMVANTNFTQYKIFNIHGAIELDQEEKE